VGVAFAGGAYVLCFAVYILRAEKYHAILRATVLNGWLAYCFYASAILLDLGRWWNIFNPIVGNHFGTNSVLFLVAWHFLLYNIALFLEFSPAAMEWLGLKRARKLVGGLVLGASVIGIMLSTGHQSGLGALFMMAKGKIHPLWYSEYIPLIFLVSSVFAGLSMVIFEGSISHRVFHNQLTEKNKREYPSILTGLAKACAASMFVYLFLQITVTLHGHEWNLLGTRMGIWYLVEVVGLVTIPMLMFVQGARTGNLVLIKVASVLTMLGVILNRLSYSIIAFKWTVPLSERYLPTWMEIVITLCIVFSEIWAFRWIVHRMPILSEPPAWAREADAD
jgi:Ni/Fe-hydrogenase subunit HybB-like protein